MPTVHDDLIKGIAALTKLIGKTSNPEFVATEMLRLINADIEEHPDLWPRSLESQMAEANVLISEHFA